MSLGFGPRRFPTSTLTSKLSSDAYVRGVVAWPAVSASSLMRKASATRRARTLHSSAKSNVRRETVKKTRRQNTNCPYGNKNNQRNKKETLTVHRVGDHSLVHVHGARHAHVGVVPAHEHDGEVGGLRGFDSRVCHLSNERENRIHRVCKQNTRAVSLIARVKINVETHRIA